MKRCPGSYERRWIPPILVRRVLPELQELAKKGKNGLVATMQMPTGLKYRQRKSNEEEIEVLEWPSQSLNLNPIEHLWIIPKTSLTKRKRMPRTLDEVWAYAREE